MIALLPRHAVHLAYINQFYSTNIVHYPTKVGKLSINHNLPKSQ